MESATANEIANASRVPRAKLYEVLETLNRKGLLDIIPETPQRFRANPLGALYDTRLAELRNEERQLKETIGELMIQLLPGTREKSGDPERDFLHLSRGRIPLVNAFTQLVERSERRLWIVGDPLLLARLRVYEDILQKLVRFQDKAELRILVPNNYVAAVEGRTVHVDELADVVRILPFSASDAMLAVRDDLELLEAHLVPNDLHPSRGSDRVITNRDAALARLTGSILEGLWPQARPYVSGLTGRR